MGFCFWGGQSLVIAKFGLETDIIKNKNLTPFPKAF